jgi:hypothetical protein
MLSTRILVRSESDALTFWFPYTWLHLWFLWSHLHILCRKYPSLNLLSYICLLPSPSSSSSFCGAGGNSA